ncbi:phospholipase D-like domain-containing protein [uncultured Pseudosulfitobacter sp.]|uniref:phospholipase D-like domain-containing protein n=1 Tax=uncultured Pseudosulfitobacter sp. TaxID=2854214 RepID=UPI0030DA3772|tara:strand:- start:5313 stop:6857 length:1545 start_codon:yes stop_codon:yes gene_type:complete
MTAQIPAQARIFLTASEAYPALETLFLDAKEEILAGFRVFDPATPLYSDRGRDIGDTWFDLIEHTLRRGVRFRMLLTDFDPIIRPDMHRATWLSKRRMILAAEASGNPHLLDIVPAMHPARVGWLPRIFLWPKIISEIRTEVKRLNALPEQEAAIQLKHAPGLCQYISGDHPDLKVSLRQFPALIPTTHHQKLAIADGTRLMLGGLDLNERRYDTPEHRRDGPQTWHDAQIMCEGPIVEQAQRHLTEMLAVTNGTQAPQSLPLMLRTLSRKRNNAAFHMSPHTVLNKIEVAHLDMIAKAQHLIYLESQYFRSRVIAKALARAAREKPDLKLILVLPAAPDDVAFEHSTKSDARFGEYLQAKAVRKVTRAFGKRCLVMSPARPVTLDNDSGRAAHFKAPMIYLHAKVSIFDDTDAIISSANLNGRSMRWDTEVGMHLTDPQTVATLKQRSFDHWLPQDATPDYHDLQTAVSAWRKLAVRNAKLEPEQRAGFVLPFPIAPARRFGRNLPAVPEELV